MEKKQCTNDICLCASDDERNECGYFNEVEPSTSLPTEENIINFLLGSSEFMGAWFGGFRPSSERGSFWWRKYLREYVQDSDLQKKQLTEKNRELEEYKRLNTISLSGYTPEELHDKISTLQDRVRELEDILNGSISME